MRMLLLVALLTVGLAACTGVPGEEPVFTQHEISAHRSDGAGERPLARIITRGIDEFPADPTLVEAFLIRNDSLPGNSGSSSTLTLESKEKDPRLEVAFPDGNEIERDEQTLVEVWFSGVPVDGEYSVTIYGAVNSIEQTPENVKLTLRIVSGCAVGNVLFEWTPSGPAGPVGGILSVEEPTGGQACRAVNWSPQADQHYVTASPVAGEVAYMADGSLWIVPIQHPVDENHNQTDDTPPEARKTDGVLRDLAWSPDGRMIACTDYGASPLSIVILDAADPAGARRVVSDGSGSDQHPTWSPDLDSVADGYQGKLYFVRNEQELMSLEVTHTGAITDPQSTAPTSLRVFDSLLAPACSPDGTRIAFVEYLTPPPGGGEIPTRLRVVELNDLASPGPDFPSSDPDDRDSEPAWWDDDVIVFSRFLNTGPNPGQGRQALFQVDADGITDPVEIDLLGPLGQPLDGDASRPAIVPAAVRAIR